MVARAARRSGRLSMLVAVLALLWYAADLASKQWAIATLTGSPPRQLVGDLLRLYLIRNPGAAFSLGTGSTWVLTLLAIVVLVVVVRSSRRLGSRGWAVAFGMLLGGALGNLTDRLTREPGVGRGHVVDFIDYNGWFIGNVADIAIVAAACLIALLAMFGIRLDGSREGERAPESDESPEPDVEAEGSAPHGSTTE